jgi:hypothetical protein
MMSLSYSTIQCYYMVSCSCLYTADEDSCTSWCVYTDCLCNKFKSINIYSVFFFAEKHGPVL